MAMMNDPSVMMNMMQGNFAMMVPQMVMMGIVNYFFSGYVIGKIPFPLTPSFKASPRPDPDPGPSPNPSPNPNPNPNPSPNPNLKSQPLTLTLTLTPTPSPRPRACCSAA